MWSWTDEELLDHVRQLADELGRPPLAEEVRDDPDSPSYGAYQRREWFDSWVDVIERAGLDVEAYRDAAYRQIHIPEEDLVDEFEAAEMVLGRPPTSEEMNDYGAYAHTTYCNRFGPTWPDVVDTLAIDPDAYYDHVGKGRVDEIELLADVREVADDLGHPPSLDEAKEHCEHSLVRYEELGDYWADVLKQAGLIEPYTPQEVRSDE